MILKGREGSFPRFVSSQHKPHENGDCKLAPARTRAPHYSPHLVLTADATGPRASLPPKCGPGQQAGASLPGRMDEGPSLQDEAWLVRQPRRGSLGERWWVWRHKLRGEAHAGGQGRVQRGLC